MRRMLLPGLLTLPCVGVTFVVLSPYADIWRVRRVGQGVAEHYVHSLGLPL